MKHNITIKVSIVANNLYLCSLDFLFLINGEIEPNIANKTQKYAKEHKIMTWISKKVNLIVKIDSNIDITKAVIKQ